MIKQPTRLTPPAQHAEYLASPPTVDEALVSPPGRRRARHTGPLVLGTAVVVVAVILAELLLALGALQRGAPTSARWYVASTPIPPTVTLRAGSVPGPASARLPYAMPSDAPPSAGDPVRGVWRFRRGQPIYLTYRAAPLRDGRSHLLTIRWLVVSADGQPRASSVFAQPIPPLGGTLRLTGTAGQGIIQLYWDLPPGDTGTDAHDPALAWTILLTITDN